MSRRTNEGIPYLVALASSKRQLGCAAYGYSTATLAVSGVR